MTDTKKPHPSRGTIKTINPPDTGDRIIQDGRKKKKKTGYLKKGLANV